MSNSPEEILQELTRSKALGSALGIYAEPLGSSMLLALVADIIESDILNDKIILLKQYDTQGRFIETIELYMSEIYRVRPFKTKFNEDLSAHSDIDELDTKKVKIKQQEQVVTQYELQLIIINNIESGNRLKIKKNVNPTPLEFCYIRGFADAKFENFFISCGMNDEVKMVIHVNEIDFIEFDYFFYFKGLSSRIFKVLR